VIDDPDLRRLFAAESEEHLAHLDDGLLRLEKTPADPPLLEEMFRESHSLKGAARMLGLTGIEGAAHGLESLFNAARKGETPLTPALLKPMNAALADLRRRVGDALLEAPEPVHVVQRWASPIPEPAPSIPPTPRPAPIEPVDPPAVPAEVFVAPAVDAILPPMEAVASSAPFRIETVRVETRKLDELLTQVGEISVIQGRARHRLGLLDELLELWERTQIRRGAGAAARRASGGTDSRFGDLLKQARAAFADDSARLEATLALLSDQVRGIRLLPLSTVFSLFPRMTRDLAREQGKETELVLAGGDIAVDKRILEAMKDPLMHLLRNAIDHGIEPPAERERLGKPRAGGVWLSARRDNDGVVLEVRDDGRGLDLDAIRREAAKRGLHAPETLAAMAPAQVRQLIFAPGFSTSGFVTELSGRGVGLDVVRVNVERLKGAISLESSPGQGLAVHLRLPLSITTTRILLASVGGLTVGIPVEFVWTTLRPRAADLFTLEGRTALLLDDEPLIAARLAHLLERPAGARGAPESDVLACVVLQVGGQRLGLLADAVLAEEEVVPKPLGAPLQRVRNVSALAVLGDGTICPLLNPADLLRSANRNGVVPIPVEPMEQPDSNPRAVLLVEDSVLIRAMEKRVLEDGGYQVTTAVDGVDALAALGRQPFAAVVSDIMMPNMDGLTLTTRIRAEPRYKALPVILVTTLASDEDKRRGLEAGANAYLPKPAFDQRVLLDALKRLI
jgi:two-component system chemotaxis sensor kinase CheA